MKLSLITSLEMKEVNCLEAIKKRGYEEHKEECLFGEWKGLLHQKELRKWGY
jgi:hypothetical protein